METVSNKPTGKKSSKKKIKRRESSSSESSDDESEVERKKKKKNKRRSSKCRNRREASTESESEDEDSSSQVEKRRTKKRKERKKKDSCSKKKSKKKSRRKCRSSSSDEELSSDSPEKKTSRKSSRKKNYSPEKSKSRRDKRRNSTSESEDDNSKNVTKQKCIPTAQLFDYSSSSDENSKKENNHQKCDSSSYSEKSQQLTDYVSNESNVTLDQLVNDESMTVLSEINKPPASAAKSKIACKFLPSADYIPLGRSPLVTTERHATSSLSGKKLSPVPGGINSEKAAQPEKNTTPNGFLTKRTATSTSSGNKATPISVTDNAGEIRHSLPLTLLPQKFGSAHQLQRPIYKAPAKISFQKPLSQARLTAGAKQQDSSLPMQTVRPQVQTSKTLETRNDFDKPSAESARISNNSAPTTYESSPKFVTKPRATDPLAKYTDRFVRAKSPDARTGVPSQSPQTASQINQKNLPGAFQQENNSPSLTNRDIDLTVLQQAPVPQNAPKLQVTQASKPAPPDVSLPPPCLPNQGSNRTGLNLSQAPPSISSQQRPDLNRDLADDDDPPDEVISRKEGSQPQSGHQSESVNPNNTIALKNKVGHNKTMNPIKNVSGGQVERFEPIADITILESTMESFLKNQDQNLEKLNELKQLNSYEQEHLEGSIKFINSLMGR